MNLSVKLTGNSYCDPLSGVDYREYLVTYPDNFSELLYSPPHDKFSLNQEETDAYALLEASKNYLYRIQSKHGKKF